MRQVAAEWMRREKNVSPIKWQSFFLLYNCDKNNRKRCLFLQKQKFNDCSLQWIDESSEIKLVFNYCDFATNANRTQRCCFYGHELQTNYDERLDFRMESYKYGININDTAIVYTFRICQ